MRLHDTLTDSAVLIEPQGPAVTLYVCGITPYDTTHLGHAFTYCAADVLVRYLGHKGLTTRYCQNITDIDDDILRQAAAQGEDWRALGTRWTRHFVRDMQALHVLAPDYYPRATSHIPQIIACVEALLSAGVAYPSGRSVYYSVDAWSRFGALSHLPREAMLPVANERGNRPDDPHKRDPLDFVLWQAQTPGEPAWDSPWGPGRPGWHIECSTLATHLLGETVDIHGGGSDLIFPHHECEIAQAEAVFKRPFVRCWLHTAMVEYQGEKMSKSLGNLVMVADLLRDWPADALRVYLATHHYRQSWGYEPDELAQAAALAYKLQAAVTVRGGRGAAVESATAEMPFLAAMDDDLDTPAALKVMEHLADAILAGAQSGRRVLGAQAHLRTLCQVFGLRLDTPGPEPRVEEGWGRHLAALA